MSYKYQLIDAKQSTLKQIAAVCPNSTAFVDLVNEAQRRLLKRGNWFGTEILAQFCIHGGCITWPRHVGTVLGVKMGCEEVELRNHWYSIIGPSGWSTYNGFGAGFNLAGFNDCGSEMTEVGVSPCYNEISGTTGKLIRYYPTKQNDVGKTITLYGKQYGGQPLQRQDTNGDWIPGIVITAAMPFGTNSTLVTHIDSVVRDASQAPIGLYEYDSTTNLVRDLAWYEPSETNPRYRQSRINGFRPGCKDSNGRCITRLNALIKLEHIPLVNDYDFLIIDDFDALKLAIQAIKLEEANNDELANAKWIEAVHELNLEDRNKLPNQQTPVKVRVVGGCAITSPY